MTVNSTPKSARALVFALSAAVLAVCPAAFGQGLSSNSSIAPTEFFHADAAQLVDPPNVPMPVSDLLKTQSPAFRPTMSQDAYAAAKLAASEDFGWKSPDSAEIRPNNAGSVVKFSGLNENASADLGVTSSQSECSGAIGTTQYAEITDDAFAVYSRTGTLLKTTPLSLLFKYTAEPIINPLVRYDPLWNRWIVTATSQPENPTTQYFHIAISKTDDAKGPFWMYPINMTYSSGITWDDERTGLTQDAVLFDANVFSGNTYLGATFFSIAKAELYNGYGYDVEGWTGLNGTLALPIVMDQEANTYLMYDVPGTSNVGVYTVTNAANGYGGETLNGPVSVHIPGAGFLVPPPAAQPGTRATLDTLDTRFTPGTVEKNGIIYAVDCVESNGYPVCQAVLVDYTASPITSEVEPFYVSPTSYDFNPSLAVDNNGDLAVEWNSTDPAAGKQVSIYANAVAAGSTLPVPYGAFIDGSPGHFGKGDAVQPWGDCSSLTVDPVDGTTWWGSNQLVMSEGSWKTENFSFVTQ